MPAKLFNRYTQYFDTYFLSSFKVPNVESKTEDKNALGHGASLRHWQLMNKVT